MPAAKSSETPRPDWLLSPEESWQWFDDACQRELGISAREFIDKYRAGELVDDDEPENWGIGRLAMSIPSFE